MLDKYLLDRHIRFNILYNYHIHKYIHILVKKDLLSIKILLSNTAGKRDVTKDIFLKLPLNLKFIQLRENYIK